MASETASGARTEQPVVGGHAVASALALAGIVLGLFGFSLSAQSVGPAGTVEEVVWPGIADTALVCTFIAVGRFSD